MSDSITLRDVLAMDRTTWMQWLTKQRPSEEMLAWVAIQPSARAAWATCDRPDWLLWLCRTLYVGYDDPRRYVRCALAAAQAVESRMLDLASRDALALVERWLRDEANNAEMLKAVGWAAWAMRTASHTAAAAVVAAADAAMADAAADAAAAKTQTVDAAVAEARAAASRLTTAVPALSSAMESEMAFRSTKPAARLER